MREGRIGYSKRSRVEEKKIEGKKRSRDGREQGRGGEGKGERREERSE